MMKLKYNRATWFSCMALFIVLSTTVSCKKFLDVDAQNGLTKEQTYRDIYDADAAVLGVYGKFMNLAKQYVILNELRADLMTVTQNSDPHLREINEHQVNMDNPYASPKAFYEVILNCNDVLANFKVMLADKKFTNDEYQQRYSDIGAIRSWVYLQLGIQFGSVPYVTDPLENIDDIKDASKFPKLTFEQLLDKLLEFTEALPFKNLYPQGTSLVTAVDGYNTAKFFINKHCLLGDLNLWKGNYTIAATYYKNVMNTVAPEDRRGYYIYTNTDGGADGVTRGYGNAIKYVRYREQDVTALYNSNSLGWRAMFARGQDDLYNDEWIWMLYFDKNFAPKNPFVDLFSNRGGKYLVKPSVEAIDEWNAQTQFNGVPYDARGFLTYKLLDGKPVIMKYLYNFLGEESYTPVNIFEKTGKWYLYRASKLHLRFAEAANRDNRHKLSNALIGQGVRAAYTVSGITDKTNIEQTHDSPPYDFDARNGDFPRFRGKWHLNAGSRGKSYLPTLPIVGDSTISIENNIITEAGLELAYEGNRWEDLVRIARRRNDPAFLAEKVYQKLLKEGDPKAATVRAKLMVQDNWYLPFKW